MTDWTMGETREPLIAEQNEISARSAAGSGLSGLWAPCLTPVHSDLSIDNARLLQHVQWLLSNGCHGIVLFGTTGEAPSFSASERMQALEALISDGISPSSIIVGNGFTALSDTLLVSKHAVALGCRAVLMVPPFYFKEPSAAGLAAYYRHVLDELDCPELKVLLYHFPRLSAVPISHELINALIESHGDMIEGLKDSSGEWQSVREYIQRYPNLSIFPGTDALLLKGLQSGGVGTITATADINPHGIRRVIDLWNRGVSADDAQKDAETIRSIVFEYPLAPALKAVHANLRSDENWDRLRPPLVSLGAADQKNLMNSLAEAGFKMP